MDAFQGETIRQGGEISAKAPSSKQRTKQLESNKEVETTWSVRVGAIMRIMLIKSKEEENGLKHISF